MNKIEVYRGHELEVSSSGKTEVRYRDQHLLSFDSPEKAREIIDRSYIDKIWQD